MNRQTLLQLTLKPELRTVLSLLLSFAVFATKVPFFNRPVSIVITYVPYTKNMGGVLELGLIEFHEFCQKTSAGCNFLLYNHVHSFRSLSNVNNVERVCCVLKSCRKETSLG